MAEVLSAIYQQLTLQALVVFAQRRISPHPSHKFLDAGIFQLLEILAMGTTLAKKIRSVGYESHPDRLAKLDGRTREAALVRRTREQLTAHVKNPSVAQAALIERAAWLTLRISLLEARLSGPEGMSDHSARQYLAFTNALRRTLDAIGIRAALPPARAPTLAELLAQPQGAAA